MLESESDRPSSAQAAHVPSKQPLLFRLALALAFLSLLRISLEHLEAQEWKWGVLVVGAALVLFTRTIRAAVLDLVAFSFFISLAWAVHVHWQELRTGSVGYLDMVRLSWSQLAGMESVGRLKRAITVDMHLPYLQAVDPANKDLNVLAGQLVQACPRGDKACEADSIVRHVSSTIRYVSDPRVRGDYIKAPQHTLQAGAGDCEDVTILVSSLLETVGVQTYFAFEPRHVYPVACFEEALPFQFVEMKAFSRATGKRCYAMEPTATGSGLGVPGKSVERVEAFYDVRRRQALRLKT